MAPRHLFIVARAHPSVYEYLVQQFTADADVEVRLDRRRADRRTSQGSGVENERRRQSDRRTRPDVDAQLRERSHYFLTLPDPTTLGERAPA